jgi:nucleoside-triphosphatase
VERGANFLIAGPPGAGKTTVIKRLAAELGRFSPAGFVTEDLRVEERRVGFLVTSLDGRALRVPYTAASLPRRFGRYELDASALEKFLSPLSRSEPRLILLDEIGKLDPASTHLAGLIRRWLSSSAVVIASVAGEGPGLVGEVKEREDVELYNLTHRNAERLIDDISHEVHLLLGGE